VKSFADIPERGDELAAAATGDLFSLRPAPAVKARRRGTAPELAAARVLCHQLKRKRAGVEKKRIIHQICLNLVAVLKRHSPQAQ